MASNLNATILTKLKLLELNFKKTCVIRINQMCSTLMAISSRFRLVLFCVHCSLWLFQQFENATWLKIFRVPEKAKWQRRTLGYPLGKILACFQKEKNPPLLYLPLMCFFVQNGGQQGAWYFCIKLPQITEHDRAFLQSSAQNNWGPLHKITSR